MCVRVRECESVFVDACVRWREEGVCASLQSEREGVRERVRE